MRRAGCSITAARDVGAILYKKEIRARFRQRRFTTREVTRSGLQLDLDENEIDSGRINNVVLDSALPKVGFARLQRA